MNFSENPNEPDDVQGDSQDRFKITDDGEIEYIESAYDEEKPKGKRKPKARPLTGGKVTLDIPLALILVGLIVLVAIVGYIVITSRVSTSNDQLVVIAPSPTPEIDLASVPFCSDQPVTDNERIVMSIGDMQITNLFITNGDGSKSCRLMNNDFSNGFPAISPDGDQIAFDSTRSGRVDIFVMNADGSNVKNLTADCKAGSGAPDWSPDGKQIVFTSACNGERESNLYIMARDGSGKHPITKERGVDTEPRWSPDGSHIVFASTLDKVSGLAVDYEICIVDPDGGNLRRITNNEVFDAFPVWLPGHQGISYQSTPAGSTTDVIVYDPDPFTSDTFGINTLDVSETIPVGAIVWLDSIHVIFKSSFEGFSSLYSVSLATPPYKPTRIVNFQNIESFDWWQRSQ